MNRAPNAYQQYMMSVMNSLPPQEETRSNAQLRNKARTLDAARRVAGMEANRQGLLLPQDPAKMYDRQFTTGLRDLGATAKQLKSQADTAWEYADAIASQRAATEAWKNYSHYRDNPDFIENSKPDLKVENRIYYSMAHPEEAIAENGAAVNAAAYADGEDKAMYFYLWNTQGSKAANTFYDDYVKNKASAAKAAVVQMKATAEGYEKPFLSSVKSLGTNAISGVGLVDMFFQNIARDFGITNPDRALNYNSLAMMPSIVTDSIREGVMKKINGQKVDDETVEAAAWTAAWIYQLGMSMADSSVGMALNLIGVPKAATLALMGGAAGTRAIREARNRGATDGEALAFGFASAIAEAAFEELSLDVGIDNVMKQFNGTKTTGRALMDLIGSKTGFKNRFGLVSWLTTKFITGVVEGSEESFTTIANTLADRIIMGDNRQFELQRQALLKQGVSTEEATKAALKSWFADLYGDVLGGFLSGDIMGGIQQLGGLAAGAVYGARQTAADINNALLSVDVQNMVNASRAEAQLRRQYEQQKQQKMPPVPRLTGWSANDTLNEEPLADYHAGFDMLDPYGTNRTLAKATKAAAKDIRAVEKKGTKEAAADAKVGIEMDSGKASIDFDVEGTANGQRDDSSRSEWGKNESEERSTGVPTEEFRGTDRSGAKSRSSEGNRRALVQDQDSEGVTISPETYARIKNTDVVDKSGRPVAVYHATGEVFDEFKIGDIGFHTGTYEQAIERARKRGIKNPIIIRGYLNHKNTVALKRDVMSWHAAAAALALWDEGYLTTGELKEILSLGSGSRSSNAYNSEGAIRLREMLCEKGIDGLSYPNAFERDGISYISLYNEQIVRTPSENGKASTESGADYLAAVDRGEPAPQQALTVWQQCLDEYDRETARASALSQPTVWQAYLDENDRLWAELMELASREPEQQDTVWKQCLREYDEAQRREEALKTVEILGYVPEEYAELFGVEPGTSWLVVYTYEQRRKLRAQRQNADEAFEWTQPERMEDDAPENTVDNSAVRGIIGNEDRGVPKSWGKLGEISDNDVLKGTNPNFRSDIPQYLNGTNDDYTYNCTNCVVAYSQRRKGYDVTAKAVGECGTLRSNNRLFSAWEGRAPTLAKGSGIEEITAYMNGCEDGALVAITIKMPGSVFSPSYGHAFVAEKIDGKIMFLNPQSGQRITRPEEFFEMVKVGSTRFMRVDDLPITDRGISACKEASK